MLNWVPLPVIHNMQRGNMSLMAASQYFVTDNV